jgi:hypothetical protein
MFKKKWPFKDKQNVMVITTKSIVINGNPILYISHDEEDGMWQFHDGTEANEEDGTVISLKEMLELDTSISEIADLPCGWYAWRNNINDTWKRQKAEL